jgi:hypothetical protein
VDLRLAIPEQHVSADVLDAGLEALTRLDQAQIERGDVPMFRDANPGTDVKWKPEPPGAECFDHAAKALKRGWGDCDDLAPWHSASLRASGEDPDAFARVVKSGPNRWHAIVQRGDGTIDDPSVEAGMPHAVVGSDGSTISPPPPSLAICPAVLPRMFAANRPAIAVRANAVTGLYEARADLPWLDSDYALSVLKSSPVAATAIVGAIRGVCGVGKVSGVGAPAHLRRLSALGAILMGHRVRDVASVVGGHAVHDVLPLAKSLGGFDFGGLFKTVEPFVSKAVSFIPGVGPIAATALDITNQFIPAGGGTPAQHAQAAQAHADAAQTAPTPQEAQAHAHAAIAHAHAAQRPHAPAPRPPAPAPPATRPAPPGTAAAAMPPTAPHLLHVVPGQGGHVLVQFR